MPDKQPYGDHAFYVTRRRIVPVTTYREEIDVLYEGEDWLAAEDAYHRGMMSRADGHLWLIGTHPSHRIENTQCSICGAPDNGCFKIHAPCGYDLAGRSIKDAMDDERGARGAR